MEPSQRPAGIGSDFSVPIGITPSITPNYLGEGTQCLGERRAHARWHALHPIGTYPPGIGRSLGRPVQELDRSLLPAKTAPPKLDALANAGQRWRRLYRSPRPASHGWAAAAARLVAW